MIETARPQTAWAVVEKGRPLTTGKLFTEQWRALISMRTNDFAGRYEVVEVELTALSPRAALSEPST